MEWWDGAAERSLDQTSPSPVHIVRFFSEHRKVTEGLRLWQRWRWWNMWILWQPHLGFEKITLEAEQSIIQGPKGRVYMWRQAGDSHILGERVKTLHSTEDPALWSGSLLSRQPSLWEACLTAGREALCSELTPYMEKADRLKIQPSNHQSLLSPCEWGPPTWNDKNVLVWGIWQNDLHISLKAFKYTQISPVLKQKQLSFPPYLCTSFCEVSIIPIPNADKGITRKLQTSHCYECKLKIR